MLPLQAWTSGLGFKVKEGWRPWIADDQVCIVMMVGGVTVCTSALQVAGYVTEYDANGFKFVTVKGSGHMVIQYTATVVISPLHNYFTLLV